MNFQQFSSITSGSRRTLLLIAVVVLMVRRRLFREFPAFLVYSIFEVLQFSSSLLCSHLPSVSGGQYYDVYLVWSGISAALRFGVIHEIFENVFRNYSAHRSVAEGPISLGDRRPPASGGRYGDLCAR